MGTLSVYKLSEKLEKREWLSTYKGFFHEDRKHGIGMFTSRVKKRKPCLGIWHLGKLWMTLKTLNSDTIRCSTLNQIMTDYQPTCDRPRSVCESDDKATQTGETETVPESRNIQVYSLSVLSSIPRKEFCVANSCAINTVVSKSQKFKNLFVNGLIFPMSQSRKTTFLDIELQNPSKAIVVHYVRCSSCGKSADMCPCSSIHKDSLGWNADFCEILRCHSGACASQNTRSLYCKICARDAGNASTPLYELEHGRSGRALYGFGAKFS
jgi:hypothetical protein